MSLLKYLDTIIAAHSAPPGSTKHNYSPWLFLDAAHVLFETAKSRVYRGKITGSDVANSSISFPSTLQPVLEEQPKWQALADVLQEIEQDIYFNPVRDDSNNVILIMCSDQRTCRQLREYLESRHVKPELNSDNDANNDEDASSDDDGGRSAELMMRRKLREYLNWKLNFARAKNDLYSTSTETKPSQTITTSRAPPNKRRRVRGGSSAAATSGRGATDSVQVDVEAPGQVSELLNNLEPKAAEESVKNEVVIDDLQDAEDYYELYDMSDLIMIHPYDGDMDERILEEARPRYIIMYEPDAAFIRRVEVYRSSHTDRNVRVYFMYYGGSVEEQRYLSAVRREKDAFTKLIKERRVRETFDIKGVCFISLTMIPEHGSDPHA